MCITLANISEYKRVKHISFIYSQLAFFTYLFICKKAATDLAAVSKVYVVAEELREKDPQVWGSQQLRYRGCAGRYSIVCESTYTEMGHTLCGSMSLSFPHIAPSIFIDICQRSLCNDQAGYLLKDSKFIVYHCPVNCSVGRLGLKVQQHPEQHTEELF